MVTDLAAGPHECENSEGSVSRDLARDHFLEHDDSCSDGQHSPHALHQQAKNITLVESVSDGRKTLSIGEAKEDSADGISPSRTNKPTIRRTILSNHDNIINGHQ